jgi:hypothetical protein
MMGVCCFTLLANSELRYSLCTRAVPDTADDISLEVALESVFSLL